MSEIAQNTFADIDFDADDDDDDFDFLPWGFNHVFIPTLIAAGVAIAACVGSAAAYATIYIWMCGATLVGW